MGSLRILLTGANGFLGSHLERSLRESHTVFAPRHDELDLLDLQSIRTWLDHNPVDLVIHAATWNATSVSDKPLDRVLEANLRMFFHLAGERNRFRRLVHFGSGAEFDRSHWREDLREEELGLHVPTDAYGLSKFIAAQYTEASEDITNLRLFGVMGSGEDWRVRFPSECAVRALYGLPLKLRQDRRFDYLDATDVASALAELIHLDRWPRTLNICRGETHLLSDMASIIQRELGTDLPLEVAIPGLDRSYGGDASALKTLLPQWKPRSLNASVGELCERLAARRENLDPRLLVAP